jgi:hypothetical protein
MEQDDCNCHECSLARWEAWRTKDRDALDRLAVELEGRKWQQIAELERLYAL